MAPDSLLEAELEAVTETGLYESRESFLSDAVQTLFAARPDLRETVACRLYEKGIFSLGRAAEWTGLSRLACKISSFVDCDQIADLVQALRKRDHYSFRGDVLVRLLA